MENFTEQIANILTSSPGNLIVHLVLVFSIMATFQAVLATRHAAPHLHTKRLYLGLAALLVGQITLFTTSGLAWQGMIEPRNVLPPLDRAVAAWSLLWIVWLWGFPRPMRLADIINSLLNVVVVVFLLLTLIFWRTQSQLMAFNASLFDWGWGLFSILICLVGTLFLLLERRRGWGIGIGILALNLVGYTTHLIYTPPIGDYAAALRLAQLCSYPLLPSLALRLKPTSVATEPAERILPFEERRRYTADARAVHAWLQVIDRKAPTSTCNAVMRAIAQTMLADLCCFVSTPSSLGSMAVQSGYDLIRDENLKEMVLDKTNIPALANAIERGRPLCLEAESYTGGDLRALAEVIGLEQCGNLLAIPLASSAHILGSIVLLSPYSHRVWTAEDQNYLTIIASSLYHILKDTWTADPHQNAASNNDLGADLEEALKQIRRLQEENQRLLRSARQQAAGKHSEELAEMATAAGLEAMLAAQVDPTEDEIIFDPLRFAVNNETFSMPSQQSSVEQLESELRLTLEEVAQLQNSLASANVKIMTLEMQARRATFIEPNGNETMLSTMQELRHPLTAIVGYTDLLASESVGILGAMQKKFVDRIRVATDRLQMLLDNLIDQMVSQSRGVEPSTPLVDMASVIDRAISETGAQLREKEITLQVEMPDELPSINANRDAIEQIFIHLIQNAGEVTPAEGVIHLAVRTEVQDETPCVLVQITDSGRGVSPEYFKRVFSEHYRVENPLIDGVGDTGLGLPIAKTLTEALGGRIWIESEPGETTTISVVLPVGSAHFVPVSHERANLS